MSATIYPKTGTDKALILDVRQALIYPFIAPNWTDLRLGMYLSITKDSADDDTTGLDETVTKGSYSDRLFIGFKNNSNDNRPVSAGTDFIGFINEHPGAIGFASQLLAAESTTSNPGTKFWEATTTYTEGFFNVHAGINTVGVTGTTISTLVNASGLCLPQTAAEAGGYCGLILMRLTRPDSSSTVISIGTNIPTNAGIVTYSSTPTIAAIRLQLRNFSFGSMNPTTLGTVPDAIYLYWPFFNSRLRIHALALEKFA